MINVDTAEKIHSVLIDKFGGSKGIRDKGALEAALNRPYQTFDKQELYRTLLIKLLRCSKV